MALSQAEAEKINSALKELEGLDLNNVSRERVNKMIEEVTLLLNEGNISPDSEFDERLSWFFQKARTHFHLSETGKLGEVKADDFEQGERVYTGISGIYIIKVKPFYRTLSISKVYLSRQGDPRGRYRINVNWKFNLEGRIFRIRAYLIDSRVDYPLVEVNKSKEDDPWWDSSEANVNPMPDCMRALNDKFFSYPPIRQYQAILNYGHLMATKLLEDIRNKSVGVLNELRGDELPLESIVDDRATMYMLKNASKMKPRVGALNMKGRTIRINYIERKK